MRAAAAFVASIESGEGFPVFVFFKEELDWGRESLSFFKCFFFGPPLLHLSCSLFH